MTGAIRLTALRIKRATIGSDHTRFRDRMPSPPAAQTASTSYFIAIIMNRTRHALPPQTLQNRTSTRPKKRAWFRALTLTTVFATSAIVFAHPHHERAVQIDDAAETAIHTPIGADKPGQPKVATGNDTATLELRVTDHDTGEPTACRVNVIGSDGNYYEPDDSPLSHWSHHRLGNRAGKGPFRYYGWFFYADGECVVRVPAGDVVVEVFKGYEYRPLRRELHLDVGDSEHVALELKRTAPMADLRYYSGDTHLHFDRRTETDDDRILALTAAEDIRFGSVLCMNDPSGYSGLMERQIWHQDFGLGEGSIRRRGVYRIASGQEYRANTYGHICLLLARELALPQLTVDPNRWPVFGDVASAIRAAGGYSIHAHGGYSKEIYADFSLGRTDGVELLQFAEYRGIGLEGWYHFLNAGFRYPTVGASDYPYCRALGDCRTYVHLDGEPTYADWVRGAIEGASFVTTGPLLLLEVDAEQPGATVARELNPGPSTVRIRLRCEVTPVTDLQLLVGGRTVKQWKLPESFRQGRWYEVSAEQTFAASTWVAARAFSRTASGLPDAEAHTNPVYIHVNGRPPYDRTSVDWLRRRLHERLEANTRRDAFPEQDRVLDYFRKAIAALDDLDATGGVSTGTR